MTESQQAFEVAASAPEGVEQNVIYNAEGKKMARKGCCRDGRGDCCCGYSCLYCTITWIISIILLTAAVVGIGVGAYYLLEKSDSLLFDCTCYETQKGDRGGCHDTTDDETRKKCSDLGKVCKKCSDVNNLTDPQGQCKKPPKTQVCDGHNCKCNYQTCADGKVLNCGKLCCTAD